MVRRRKKNCCLVGWKNPYGKTADDLDSGRSFVCVCVWCGHPKAVGFEESTGIEDNRGGNGKLITLFLWIMEGEENRRIFHTQHHSRRWSTKCHSELPHENKQIRPKDQPEMVSNRPNVAAIKVRLIGLEWMAARRSNNLDLKNVWTGVLEGKWMHLWLRKYLDL